MAAKKLMTYARIVLVIALLTYLLLIWMYFKDNASQLTSLNLLLWFVVVPLVFLSIIFIIRWRQKKLENTPTDPSTTIGDDESKASPIVHQVFIYSSLNLPEGQSWPEIIENDKDLTTLSDDLTDFDGLPVLIKPIDGVVTEQASSYVNDAFDDDLPADRDASSDLASQPLEVDAITLRLAALLSEQLILSDEALSVLLEHDLIMSSQEQNETNVALQAHPEWQTHYISSTKDDISSTKDGEETVSTISPTAAISELAIYLCIPALADGDYLTMFVKQQLISYGFSETLLAVHVVDTDADAEGNVEGDENSMPLTFIDQQILAMSDASVPKVCLLIAADSQINESWLEAHLYHTDTLNQIPTEASTLLLFYNQAAQTVLDIDSAASVSILKDGAGARNDSLASTRPAQYYANALGKIKSLLIDNNFVLTELSQNKARRQDDSKTKKPSAKSSDESALTKQKLSEMSITVLSDINPSKQPYDLALFMTFIDDFIEKGALVNDLHLGHYMPVNSWLPPFMSLALLIQLADDNEQESDIKFLITQHKRCCLLWLVNSTKAS